MNDYPKSLRIHIVYPDGVAEILECGVRPDIVMVGSSWQPGVVMAEPSERCPTQSDYFMTMINEAGSLDGYYLNDEGEPAFRWTLMSTAVETEDGHRFWFQPEGACWTDTQDPAASDMSCESGPDGLPVFDPPIALNAMKDDRCLSSRSANREAFLTMARDAQGRLLTDFNTRYQEAITVAGLASYVEVDLVVPFRTGRYIELDKIEATPMRAGYGTKAMQLLVDMADQQGVSLMLRVADESEDAAFDEDDPDRMPTFDELSEWYGRFGFEVDFGDRMVRVADHPVIIQRLEPLTAGLTPQL